jgi:putative tricarboxylic transport membrane protein
MKFQKFLSVVTVLTMLSTPTAFSAVKATTVARGGDECLTEGRIAPGRGIDKSDLVCTRMSFGSMKGKLLWWYPKLTPLKILEIIAPIVSKSSDSPQVIASRSADRIGSALGAALKSEELIKDFSSKNFTGGSGTLALSTFQAYRNRQSTSFIGSLNLINGIILTKSVLKLSDSKAIAQLVQEYEGIAVSTESKYKSLDQLVSDLAVNPKAVTFVGGSLGGVDHVFLAKFLKAINVDIRAVSYLPQNSGFDVVSKTMLDKNFVGLSTSGDFVAQTVAGKIRALGVASPERVNWLRVKTLQQQGIDIIYGNWYGIFVPPQLNETDAINFIQLMDVLQRSSVWKKILADNYWTNGYLSQSEFLAKLEQQTLESREFLQLLL